MTYASQHSHHSKYQRHCLFAIDEFAGHDCMSMFLVVHMVLSGGGV